MGNDHRRAGQYGSWDSQPESSNELSLSFDTLLSTTSEYSQPRHEIILVHGFGLLGDALRGHPQHYPTFGRTIGTDEHVQYYQARHILEEWVQNSATALPEPVNLRQLTFSTAEVLQHGKDVLCAAAYKLCNSLTSLTLDLESPLYLGDQGDGTGEGSNIYSDSAGGILPILRSRRVTFVAHGLGIWVVKQALLWFAYHGTPLHPAATILFDGAKFSSADLVQYYLHDTASLFSLQRDNLRGEMLGDLEAHLFVIEQHFDTLTAETYGECTEIEDGDELRLRYEMVRYNHQLWQYPCPPLQSYDEYVASGRGPGFAHRDPVIEQISRLAFLELDKHLAEAVTLSLLKGLPGAASPAIEGGEDDMDVDGPFENNAEEESTSVASSGSRYSGGHDGPPPTLPSAAALVPAEASQQEQSGQAAQTSPTKSDWSELLSHTDEQQGQSTMQPRPDGAQAECVPDETRDQMEVRNMTTGELSWQLRNSSPNNRETFDFLQMERFIGRSNAARPGSLSIDASRQYVKDDDEDTVLEGSVLFTPASSRVPDSPSESGLLIDFDRIDNTGTSGSNTDRALRPRGPLGWATMSSRTPAVEPASESAQLATTPARRPQGPLGLATMSSRAPVENRLSQGSSNSDNSISADSVLRLYGANSSGGSTSSRRTAIHGNRLSHMSCTSRRESTGSERCVHNFNMTHASTQTEADIQILHSHSGERDVLEQALQELDSEDLDPAGPQALDELIAHMSRAVEADMTTLDRHWPNIRRSLRWLLRDFEFARHEAASMWEERRAQAQGHQEMLTSQELWQHVQAGTTEGEEEEEEKNDDDNEGQDDVSIPGAHSQTRELEWIDSQAIRRTGQGAQRLVIEAGDDDFDYYHGDDEVAESGGVMEGEYIGDEDYA